MNVLIIGYGSIGKQHYQSVLRVIGKDYCHIALLRRKRDPTLDILQFDNMMDARLWHPTIIIIASPASMHIQHLAAFKDLPSVKGILVEKPLVKDFAEISQLPTDMPTVIMGFDMRQLPVLHRLKELLLEGMLGDVVGVHVRVGQALPSWRSSDNFRTDVSAQKMLGGGVVRELCHELDYLRYLGFEIASVMAKLSHSSWLALDVEDRAQIQTDLHWATYRIPGMVELDMLSDNAFRECRIECQNGRFHVDLLKSQIKIEVFGENEQLMTLTPSKAPLDLQLGALLDEALNGIFHSHVCRLKDAISISQIIAMIEQSSVNHHRVEIANNE